MKKTNKVLICLILLSSLVAPFAGATWKIGFEGKTTYSKVNDSGEPACYFYEYENNEENENVAKAGNGYFKATKYFSSVTKALKEAEYRSSLPSDDHRSIEYKRKMTGYWAKKKLDDNVTGGRAGSSDSSGEEFAKTALYDFLESFTLKGSDEKTESNFAPVITIVVKPGQSSFISNSPNKSSLTIDQDCTVPDYVSLCLPVNTSENVVKSSKVTFNDFKFPKIYEPNYYHDKGKKNNDNNDGQKSNTIVDGFNLYNGEGNKVVNDTMAISDNAGAGKSSVADSESSVASNRKNNLEIAPWKTLTIRPHGSLLIAGTLGLGYKGDTVKDKNGNNVVNITVPCGNTTGNYSQLTLATGSKVVCSGRILSYGYIKEDNVSYNQSTNHVKAHNGSSITVKDGGYVTEPIRIWDYRSEFAENALSLKSAIENKPEIPYLSIFDFPNIRPVMTLESGSALRGVTVVRTKNFRDYFYINVIDKPKTNDAHKSFFNLNSGSVSLSYEGNPFYSDDKYVNCQGNQMISIKGNVSCEDVTLYGEKDLLNRPTKFNLSGAPRPFSYKMNVVVENGGYLNLNKKSVFFPGSALTVKKGGKVTFSDNAFFFQSKDNYSNVGKVGSKIILADSSKGPAVFKVGGTAEINSGFSGLISAGEDIDSSSSVVFGPNFQNKDVEVVTGSKKNWLGVISLETKKFTGSTNIMTSSSGSSSPDKSTNYKKSSSGNYWVKQ